MKLAVFSDQVYWFDGNSYSTDEAYALFPASFVSSFDKVVFIGRVAAEKTRKHYVLDHPAISVCAMPYYDDLYGLWKSYPAVMSAARRIIRAAMPEWDVVWICGPNPIGNLIARECIKLNRSFFLVVRQNLVQQVQASNNGFRRIAAVAAASHMERNFKRLARNQTLFAVGDQIAEVYRPYTDRVHSHLPSLISSSVLSQENDQQKHIADGRLLTVGRLSAEKGYTYLLDAMLLIKQKGITYHLDVVGDGPVYEKLLAHSVALELEDEVTFHGYVPNGPELFDLYRKATAFVVSSLSEGFPQVVVEALCLGVPVVATTVGGIPQMLTHQETAVLVPPGDAKALATGIELLLGSPDLREKLSCNGRAAIAPYTLEGQRDHMLQVIAAEVMPQSQNGYRSARKEYPGGCLPEHPSVAVIVPLYNEIDHVKTVVETVLGQDYMNTTEIWFVDGGSDDGTREALDELRIRDPRVAVLSNPRRNQAAAVNLACRESQSDIVIRLDAHARYGKSVIGQSVKALLENDAAGVGAIARPVYPTTLIGRSIAAAHESCFGAGMAKFRQASAGGGWVDTVWNGCYWRHVVDEVGAFREDLWRNEDNEFNARVRAHGYGLYLSPEIDARYCPRQSLRTLWQQYYRTGVEVGRVALTDRHALGVRHLIPLTFVAGLLMLGILAPFLPIARLGLVTVVFTYVLMAIVFSIRSWLRVPGWHVILLPVVFADLHVSYGVGSLVGIAQAVRDKSAALQSQSTKSFTEKSG
jgi:glycosyltransferase involved in cell wall biosynthesis/GT2 family glycosyltransferase